MRWLRRAYTRLTMRRVALTRLRRYRDEDQRREALRRFARLNQRAFVAAMQGMEMDVS